MFLNFFNIAIVSEKIIFVKSVRIHADPAHCFDLLTYTVQGLLVGSMRSAADLLATNLEALRHSNTVRWAYFGPSSQVTPDIFRSASFN